jgi:hypothetical protein
VPLCREGEESKPAMNRGKGSDLPIVAKKPLNAAGRPDAEAVERRAGSEGNAGNAEQQITYRVQSRKRVTQALNRVRQAARQRKQERFTALTTSMSTPCGVAFYALKREAAPGMDGETWRKETVSRSLSSPL